MTANPPTAARSVRLTADDAGEVLTLQRAAYVEQALLHDDLALPPLVETLDELTATLARADVLALGLREHGRLLAAVRVTLHPERAELGRLTVVPDRQGLGLGTRLLREADDALPDSVATVDLFTGERSTANLRLYHRLGYRETHRSPAGHYELVHLRRTRPTVG